MISAKDIFTLEREMMQELINLAYRANLSSEEIDATFENVEGITQEGFEQLKQSLIAKELNPLQRIRNGEMLKASEINKAVKKAADNE